MKVLIVHNYHRSGSASGDDQVYKNETSLLEKHGHEVIRYTVSNDEFDNLDLRGKVLATFGMLWSVKNYRNIRNIIKEQNPDLVHVHTFFPLLSPSILYAAKKSGMKVVATLHDTRFVCPCAASLRSGYLCNECGDGRYWRMYKYGCFKGSKLQSLIVAFIFTYHRKKRSFYEQIDKYICLNDNQIDLLKQVGFESDKIIKKYNFLPDNKVISQDKLKEGLPERYVVFYGRIGEEKGIRILMKMWDRIQTIPLVVMGAGPLENEFSDWARNKEHVYFLGYTEHNTCLSIVKASEFVLFPSIWYEGCSMVEVESESLGKPLVATNLGFSAEAIQDGYNGFKIPLGDVNQFVGKVNELWGNPELCKEMGKNARLDYEQKYTEENNYKQLLELYHEIL